MKYEFGGVEKKAQGRLNNLTDPVLNNSHYTFNAQKGAQGCRVSLNDWSVGI